MRTHLRVILLLSLAVLPYRTEAHIPVPRLGSPAILNVADWSAIQAEYDRHRCGFFPVDGAYSARSYSQQWLAKFDGRGFEVMPNEGTWTWGLQFASYGFPGAERTVEGRAGISHDVDHASYRWNSEIEEWFINEPRGLEHGFTITQRPARPKGPLNLHLTTRGELIAHIDGLSATFVDHDGAARITYSNLNAIDAHGRALAARMIAEPSGLRIEVEEANAIYPIRIDPIAQQAYVKASNTEANDWFGNSVAISGDTVVVGAFGEASSTTGVNGNQSDNSARFAGAAYVFVRSGTSWSQQAYLKASTVHGSEQFGWSVAISGNTIVVGANAEHSAATGVNGNQNDQSAFAAGAAYAFVRNGTTWTQQAYLKASTVHGTESFGYSVSISGDTIVVGAPGDTSNATGVNGDPNNFLARASGAAYVLVRNNNTWSQQAYLKASNTEQPDTFGVSVAILGNTIVIGAPGEDSNATGVNGDQANNSVNAAGAAYVFVRNGTTWSQQAYLKAPNPDPFDQFGTSVTISEDTIVVGAPYESSGGFGSADPADNSAPEAGAAYVFARTGTFWSEQSYLKPTYRSAGDHFGWSVAVTGDTILVGAPGEDSASDNSPLDHSRPDAGAVYVFQKNVDGPVVVPVDPCCTVIPSLTPPPLTITSPTSGSTLTGIIPIRIAIPSQGLIQIKLDGANLGTPTTAFGPVYTVSWNTAATSNGIHVLMVALTRSDGLTLTTSPVVVFVTNSPWTQQQPYLKASNIDANDNFGRSVALSENTAIVGAFQESSNATGVNGNQFNNSAFSSGAAYTFTTGSPVDFITSGLSPSSSLRNEFAGFAGMQLAVGANPIVVTALGRLCVAGNNQTHIVKLVSANTKIDVPAAVVSVDMAGCTPGQFVYTTLPAQATLNPLTRYYLVSQETSGGDRWIDLGPVTSRPGADVVSSVYFNGANWIAVGAAGTSYVPPGMRFIISDPFSLSGFVLSYNHDNRPLRNDYTGFAGMSLRIGASNLTVSSLGRACVAGSLQTHIVKFVNASTGVDVPGASTSVNMAGCTADFAYNGLASPVTLLANTTYYLVSQETTGGDKWFDQSTLSTQPDATVVTSVFSQSSGYFPNQANTSYVPPTFLYTK